MTRQLHPNTLGALAALHTLTTGWQWLTDLLEPGTAPPRGTHMSPAARAQLDRLTAAERADLTATLRDGHKPTGRGTVPLVLPVLQAQIVAHDTAVDAAWAATSALRLRPMLAFTLPVGGDQARFTAACGYLAVALRIVTPGQAGQLGEDLDRAAQTVEAATGGRPNAYALRGPGSECPACGGRFLVARTYGTDDATVGCERPGGCRCYGYGCGCNRPGRTPGLRHIWPAREFGQLERLLVRHDVRSAA